MNNQKLELCLGPMSSEVIEAVYKSSNETGKKLFLIASKNQIDYNGGYVNNWTTKEYMSFINTMKEKYSESNVLVCRDHCGPGFNGIQDLKDVMSTIKADIENGFDLIHIDYCHFKGTQDEKLAASKKAVEYCLELNPNIQLEIGTDENVGSNFDISQLNRIESEVDFFQQFCDPKFYVIQTGSLVTEINQAGNFNSEFVKKASDLLLSKGITLKEHNADYLPRNEILERKGIVSAMNIAPQLGVIQTSHLLTKCLTYGIDYSKFFKVVYSGNKWVKWMDKNNKNNKMLCCLIAGHYHFSSDEYKNIVIEINKYENFSKSVINEIQGVIKHYEF